MNIEVTYRSEMKPKEPANKPLRVLFLSSDTGGGHRASAEALGAQFQAIYPNSTYELLDIIKEYSHAPYNRLVESYKHLSAHPQQWKILYKISNTQPVEAFVKTHLKLTTERTVRKRILSCNPDVVISVHPLMNAVPVIACQKISSQTGKHLPMFTVVTDLGSGHMTWFDKGVEKLFVASEQIRNLAEQKSVPNEKMVMSGLPIRNDFAMEAERLGSGGRTSLQGKIYQMQIRDQLRIVGEERSNLDSSMDLHRVVLVMGGGEGVGSLSHIVDSLYLEFAREDIFATIIVVCGRNEKLKASLETRDWDEMLRVSSLQENENVKNSILRNGGANLKRIASLPFNVFQKYQIGNNISDGSQVQEKRTNEQSECRDEDTCAQNKSQVVVHPLGFVTNMAECMVAADVLVTKAGPGTIAEAASVGLPVMLTSFLPGQEEGNVDFVLEHKFGDFKSDSDPPSIAKTVGRWLKDPKGSLLAEMSIHARAAGSPHAAEEIVRNIGTSVHRWKELHPEEDEVIHGLNRSVSQVSC